MVPNTICPFISTVQEDTVSLFKVNARLHPCLRERCELWVETYTGGTCAFTFMAKSMAQATGQLRTSAERHP